ncbi:MAG: DM13 domain-containing protein [Anaerolineae bacterium]|nr:DM13 domain-containing protein [Anaerolineae bacterium]MCA9888762.1 DM13 domain-containing protein [Anaerolineae bacterium]MCB9461267.1 DM13 domain-containing protein [Anaerolineaceae bacterium]
MDVRFRLFLIGLMGLLIAAIWMFPQWYPLVNEETIAESFPGLALEAQTSFLALPQRLQSAFQLMREGDEDLELTPQPDLALALVEARLLEDDVVSEESLSGPMPEPSATIVRSGDFITIDDLRQAEGEVTVYQRTDLSRVLIFGEEFRSMRAPEVHVILTNNPDPMDEAGVGLNYIDLGPLKGNVGWQTYEVPQDVAFNQFPILALYSVPYDYIVSTATLR